MSSHLTCNRISHCSQIVLIFHVSQKSLEAIRVKAEDQPISDAGRGTATQAYVPLTQSNELAAAGWNPGQT